MGVMLLLEVVFMCLVGENHGKTNESNVDYGSNFQNNFFLILC